MNIHKKCECGSALFWWIDNRHRCSSCYNEFEFEYDLGETWVRRFNLEEHKYGDWEYYERTTFNKEGL